MSMCPWQIGDIYRYDGGPVCVEETYTDGAMIYGAKGKLQVVRYNWVHSMPLDENWLSKIGFLNQDSEWVQTFSNTIGELITFKVLRDGYSWKAEVYYGFESPNVHRVMNVHTLQRLLRLYGNYQEKGRELLYGRN